MKFNQKQIVESSKSVGVVAAGLVAGNAAKKLLMTPRGEKGPLIPDTTIANGAVFAGTLIGASMVQNSNLSLFLASLSAYFGIRTLNKGTEAVAGLGNPTANRVASTVRQWLPDLGNTDNAMLMPDTDEFERIISRASMPSLPASSMPVTISPEDFILKGVNQPDWVLV